MARKPRTSSAEEQEATTTITEIRVHPACLMFDPVEGDTRRAMLDDIRQNGVRTAVAVYREDPTTTGIEGLVLIDGRTRMELNKEAGRKFSELMFDEPFPAGTASDADIVEFIVSANIHRRQITTNAAKDRMLERLWNAFPQMSAREIAKKAGTSHVKASSKKKEMQASGKTFHPKVIGGDGRSYAQPKRNSMPPSNIPNAPSVQQLTKKLEEREKYVASLEGELQKRESKIADLTIKLAKATAAKKSAAKKKSRGTAR